MFGVGISCPQQNDNITSGRNERILVYSGCFLILSAVFFLQGPPFIRPAMTLLDVIWDNFTPKQVGLFGSAAMAGGGAALWRNRYTTRALLEAAGHVIVWNLKTSPGEGDKTFGDCFCYSKMTVFLGGGRNTFFYLHTFSYFSMAYTTYQHQQCFSN